MKKLVFLFIATLCYTLINCSGDYDEIIEQKNKITSKANNTVYEKYSELLKKKKPKRCKKKKQEPKYSLESLSPLSSFFESLQETNPKFFVKPHKEVQTELPNNYLMLLPNELLLKTIKMAIVKDEAIVQERKISPEELNTDNLIPFITKSTNNPDRTQPDVILTLLQTNPKYLFQELTFDALKQIFKATKISNQTLAIIMASLDSKSAFDLQEFGVKKLKHVLSKEKLNQEMNIFNRSDLSLAAALNCISALRLLIKSGADVNILDEADGATPLMSAAMNNNLECTKILLEAGSDVYAINTNQESALSLVCRTQEGEFAEVAQLLMEYISNNREAATKIFNLINKEEEAPPLMQAICNNHTKIVEILVKNGADVNYQFKGLPMLVYAMLQTNSFDICKTLISEKTINLDYQDPIFSATTLIYAVQKNMPEIVKLLLENGANPNLKDNQNLTAFDYAKNGNYTKILEHLQKYISFDK